jgi:signal transduction histidine kinase
MREQPTNFSAVLGEYCSGHELEELTRTLLAAQEEERRQIAADLHDEIGQCLSAVQFAISGLRHQMGDRASDAEDEMFACLVGRVSKTIGEVRRICMGLRPPMLDDIGIVSTIDWYCGELRQVLPNLDLVEAVSADEDAIHPVVKVAIFRILQEACGNACKHARASRLSVRLQTDAEGIRLEVEDDGVGFDPATVRGSARGMGLASMRERVAMTGGEVTLESQVGRGTRILVTWAAQEQAARTPPLWLV